MKRIKERKKVLNNRYSNNNYSKVGEMKKRVVRRKEVKINGIKTTIVLPRTINLKKFPKKLTSKPNHPKGLFLTL